MQFNGVHGASPLVGDHVEDFWNHIYRGFPAGIAVAKTLGD